jgi:carbon-monoxide dehydrogenase medium subunit
MKPAPFDLEIARSVEAVIGLLADAGREAKVLAGGQSLVPLMNFRLARPSLLVDLNRVAALQYIDDTNGGLAIGAMTRQSALERSELVALRSPLLAEVLPWIAHTPIRNRGTLGGSLAHADPAAELCVAGLALDVKLVARSSRGERVIAIDDFFLGPFSTSLHTDELLTEVRLGSLPAGTGWAFEEVARRVGDFAMIAVAAVLRLDDAGRVGFARLAYASMGPTPRRAPSGERALIGQEPTSESFANAARLAMADLEPADDLHATRAYRVDVGQALTQRALARAVTRVSSRAA